MRNRGAKKKHKSHANEYTTIEENVSGIQRENQISTDSLTAAAYVDGCEAGERQQKSVTTFTPFWVCSVSATKLVAKPPACVNMKIVARTHRNQPEHNNGGKNPT